MSQTRLGCCQWLRAHLERAGEKGYSIIAFRDGDHRAFYLQARPFERDVVEKYSVVEKTTGHARWPRITDASDGPVPYVTSMDLLLRHCPSCGANLEALIKDETRDFDALAKATSGLAS